MAYILGIIVLSVHATTVLEHTVVPVDTYCSAKSGNIINNPKNVFLDILN